MFLHSSVVVCRGAVDQGGMGGGGQTAFTGPSKYRYIVFGSGY